MECRKEGIEGIRGGREKKVGVRKGGIRGLERIRMWSRESKLAPSPLPSDN